MMKERNEYITLSSVNDGTIQEDGVNQKLNKCMIQENHAFSVIDIFPLMDEGGEEIQWYMLMIRDAFGKTAITRHDGAFCDTCSIEPAISVIALLTSVICCA